MYTLVNLAHRLAVVTFLAENICSEAETRWRSKMMQYVCVEHAAHMGAQSSS